MINAVPTIYNAKQYRSMLEARWAAFFDLLGWRIEHKPVSFNNWTPSFAINEAFRVFVEVTPAERFPTAIANAIDQSGCRDEVLIVSNWPPLNKTHLGWLRQDIGNQSWVWGEAAFGVWFGSEGNRHHRFQIGNPDNTIGFCHSDQSYHDRITGFYDGEIYGVKKLQATETKIKDLWAHAGSIVQWKKIA